MYRFLIQMKSSSSQPSANWGSLMHGMLIEHLSGHWPNALHDDQVRPVSQWVEYIGENRLLWHLQILNDPLAVCFLNSCHQGDYWYCQHNGSRLLVEKFTMESIGLEQYMRDYLTRQAFPTTMIHFRTATSHKSEGKYVLFPSVELMANSIRNRLATSGDCLSLPDEHLALLVDRTRIDHYHLQTTQFGLEGIRVTGYTGNLRLRFSGPDEIVSFGNMFFGLAEWFGIGIKTALGMGGCLVTHS